MSIENLSLLLPVLPQSKKGWFLVHEDKLHAMTEAQAQDVLSRGELAEFKWWVPSDGVALSIKNLSVVDLFEDFDINMNMNLQRSPELVAEQVECDVDSEIRVNHFEFVLTTTRRVAQNLLVSLGLSQAPEAAPRRPRQMEPRLNGSFEQKFRFWLAGVGIQGEDADNICSQQRIAACIRDSDSGDLVRELPSALYRLPAVGQEGRKLINDPGEQLRLMRFLSQ